MAGLGINDSKELQRQEHMIAAEAAGTLRPAPKLGEYDAQKMVNRALGKPEKVMLGDIEIRQGDELLGLWVGRLWDNARCEMRLTVTGRIDGRIGKQKNFYPVTLSPLDGNRFEAKTGGASSTIVTLAEWQAFIDGLPVAVNRISKTTVDLTPALIKMARDVKARRRQVPTVAEWEAEAGDAGKQKIDALRAAVDAYASKPIAKPEDNISAELAQADSALIADSHLVVPMIRMWLAIAIDGESFGPEWDDGYDFNCGIYDDPVRDFRYQRIGAYHELKQRERRLNKREAHAREIVKRVMGKRAQAAMMDAISGPACEECQDKIKPEIQVTKAHPSTHYVTSYITQVIRNGEKLINPVFDGDALTYEVDMGYGVPRKYSMKREVVISLIKNHTLIITGQRPDWVNVEPDAEPKSLVKPQDLQSADDVYGFSKQKQRLLDRTDELIEGLRAAVEKPDDPDAQRQIDGYSIVRIAGEVFLHHDNSKADLHIGTGTVYDCQRWSIVQFVRRAKFGKKPVGDDSRLAAFIVQQVDGLIADIENALKKPNAVELRGGLKLGCIIEEEEHGWWLWHPALERGGHGVQVASRKHATAELVSRIDRAEIRELVLAVREKNESKRAEQVEASKVAAEDVVAA